MWGAWDPSTQTPEPQDFWAPRHPSHPSHVQWRWDGCSLVFVQSIVRFIIGGIKKDSDTVWRKRDRCNRTLSGTVKSNIGIRLLEIMDFIEDMIIFIRFLGVVMDGWHTSQNKIICHINKMIDKNNVCPQLSSIELHSHFWSLQKYFSLHPGIIKIKNYELRSNEK